MAPVPDAQPKPGFDQITIRIVNSASMSGLLQSGDINLAEYNLSQNDLNQLRDSGFTVASEVTQQFSYLALPTDTGPFTDVRVRQAIAHAIPYQQIVDSVYFGRATRGLSTVPITSSAYTPAWEQYDTDLDKAAGLMQQAGNPQISLPLHYGNTEVTQEDMAILIKEGLGKIGIDVALTPHTSAELWDVVNARSKAKKGQAAAPEIVQFLWSAWINDPKIPIGYETTTGGVNNYSLYSNGQVDKINAEWQFAPTSTDRDAAYKRAQEVVAADLPVLPITFAERAVVLGKDLKSPSFPVSGGVRLFLLEPAN